ncbi:hypothetical protein V8E51_010937 [Hyaloscypha variabilis]
MKYDEGFASLSKRFAVGDSEFPYLTTPSSFWKHLSALFQSFRGSTSAELRVELASTVSHVSRKDSQKWARGLVERL